MSRSAVLLASAAAVALVLTGCTSGGSGDGGELTYEDSPLNVYMSAVWGGGSGESEEEMQKRFQDQQNEAEELIAQCMADEGFDYTPVDYSQNGGMIFSGDEWDPENKEWVEQYGYGAVNYPGRDEQLDPDDENAFVDPNQDYVMSLSESEMTAYYEVLYGPQPTEEEIGEDGSYEYNWETAGCQGWAQHETNGEDVTQSEEHKPLMDAMQKFWEEQATAPELSELNAQWAQCMTEAGYSGFTAQTDAAQSVYDEINEFYNSLDPEAEWVQNPPELEELGEREIELALADLECKESTDYMQKSLKAQFEREEQFIADHKAELDALKADAEQGR